MIVPAGGGLNIHCLPLGELMTNCYVLVGGSQCWVVDPGPGARPLVTFLGEGGLTPGRILLTHGHGDHIAGVGDVKKAWPGAVFAAPSREVGLLADPLRNMSALFGMPITAPTPDQIVAPGEQLDMGDGLLWQALDTAGHTPGGLSYYCPAASVVLTGDALFAGSVGRTDIPGASQEKLLGNIRRNLLTLPDATAVLPGHGPTSTIGEERQSNPFLR